MTAHQTVALAARLFAIWLFTASFRSLGATFALAERAEGATSQLYILIPLAMIAVSFMVWQFPMAVAGKLVPRTQHANAISMPVGHVSAMATATFGLWALVSAVPDAFEAYRMTLTPGFRFDFQQLVMFMVPLSQVAMGFYLLKNPWFVAEQLSPSRKPIVSTEDE